jgi:hypothetical protein
MSRLDRDEIVRVLTLVADTVAQPDTDVSWSSYHTPEQAVTELRELIAHVREREPGPDVVRRLTVLFLPTGPLQEIAISSGWGTAFLVLADRMDRALGVG